MNDTREKASCKVTKAIVTTVGLAALVYVLEFILPGYLDNKYVVSAIFAGTAIGLAAFFKFKLKASNLSLIRFMSAFALVMVYMTIRISDDAVKNGIQGFFNIDASQLGNYLTAFNVGYAGCQIFAGYLLERTGSIGYAIFASIGSIFSIFISKQTSLASIFVLRFLMGVALSTMFIGFVSEVKKSTITYLDLISNFTVFFAIQAAAEFNRRFGMVINSSPAMYKNIPLYLGMIGLVSGVVLLIGQLSDKTQQKPEISEERTNNVDAIALTSQFFKTRNLVLFALFSCFIVATYTFVQGGWTSLLMDSFYPTESPSLMTTIANKSFSYLLLVVPILCRAFGMESTMLLSSIMNLIATLVIAFYPSAGVSMMKFCAFAFAFGYTGHFIPPIMVAKLYKDGATFFYGILNGVTMIIGSAAFVGICTRVLGSIAKASSTSSSLVAVSTRNTGHDLVFVFKACLLVPSLIAVICASWLFMSKPSKDIAEEA